MIAKRFLKEENGGPVTMEYVIFVAAICILMAAGVEVLFKGMSNLFGAWANYFGAGG